jgi:hypothetical protein
MIIQRPSVYSLRDSLLCQLILKMLRLWSSRMALFQSEPMGSDLILNFTYFVVEVRIL